MEKKKQTVLAIQIDPMEIAVRILENMGGITRPAGQTVEQIIEGLPVDVMQAARNAAMSVADYFNQQIRAGAEAEDIELTRIQAPRNSEKH